VIDAPRPAWLADFQDRPVRTLLLRSAPRFARDAFGPVLAFYVGWKLIGLGAGVAAATVLSVAAWAWERAHGRPGVSARIGLAIALVQAVAGLVSGSAVLFLAPPVIVNAAYGIAFLSSVALGRPLAGLFAMETYPFPPDVRASAPFRRTFGHISLVWGAVLVMRATLRLAVLVLSTVDVYIVMNIVTGAPLTIALLVWSTWYGVRALRRSAEPGTTTTRDRRAAAVSPD
jgi:intracellular septation protein A